MLKQYKNYRIYCKDHKAIRGYTSKGRFYSIGDKDMVGIEFKKRDLSKTIFKNLSEIVGWYMFDNNLYIGSSINLIKKNKDGTIIYVQKARCHIQDEVNNCEKYISDITNTIMNSFDTDINELLLN